MKAIVTAGPTYEPIDPVRFIGNRSSGKQGYAIAKSLADTGHDVTLISGPVNIPTFQHSNLQTFHIETAKDMLEAVQHAMPAEIFIACAAVADWALEYSPQKLKKNTGAPSIIFTENPDILQTIANAEKRPKLVIGFAAETEHLIENAKAKLQSKNCDWILANDVSSENVFGQDENHVYRITHNDSEDWNTMSKTAIAEKLTQKIKDYFDHG